MTRDEAMKVFRDAISAGQALAPFAGEEAAATVIQQAFAERDGRLADHVAVHRAMLQGHIAKPSPANIWHLYQRDLLDAMPDEFKAERDGEIERLQMALRDMADAVAVYSQQPVEATRQRPQIHQDQWEQIAMICGDMLRQALAAKGDSRG